MHPSHVSLYLWVLWWKFLGQSVFPTLAPLRLSLEVKLGFLGLLCFLFVALVLLSPFLLNLTEFTPFQCVKENKVLNMETTQNGVPEPTLLPGPIPVIWSVLTPPVLPVPTVSHTGL